MTLTVNGDGAYIGLAKAHNLVRRKQWRCSNCILCMTSISDTEMVLDLNYSGNGTNFWRLYLVKTS